MVEIYYSVCIIDLLIVCSFMKVIDKPKDLTIFHIWYYSYLIIVSLLIVYITTDYMLKYANFTEWLQQLAFVNQHYTAFIRLYFG